jgi:hypothetical protein
METSQRYKKDSGYGKCDICGKTFKSRGLGTHIREAHGIKVKTIVRPIVTDSSDHSSTIVTDSSTVVQRPSDYVKKRSEVVEKEFKPSVVSPDSLGRMVCKNCGGWYMPYEWFETKGYYNPYAECLNGVAVRYGGKKHELI